MNMQEMLNICQSDFGLWNKSNPQELAPGEITLTIEAPWGTETQTIGGIIDAKTRQAGVQWWGNHIRGIVEEHTDDALIQSRATQAAAEKESRDSESGIYAGPGEVRNPRREEGAKEEDSRPPVQHAEEPTDFRASLIARRTEIAGRANEAQSNLTRWRRELKAMDAALAAMEVDDAPETSGTSKGGTEGAVGEAYEGRQEA